MKTDTKDTEALLEALQLIAIQNCASRDSVSETIATMRRIAREAIASHTAKNPTRVRKGFSVQLTRDDGSTFLAITEAGVMPFVHPTRAWAVKFKRTLLPDFPSARVVPVTFTYPLTGDSDE